MSSSLLPRIEHRVYIERKRKRLINKTPTIIANNCLGGIVAHDLGIPFNSPTVNIGIQVPDYIKFLTYMDDYLNSEIKKIDLVLYDNTWTSMLGDIKLITAHEATYEESVEKWEKRKSRIDKENMFIFMADNLMCTYEYLVMFDELPFENKVVFTHKPYPEIKSAYYIPGFEDAGEVGVLSDYKPGYWKRRWIDAFDYVSFLNGKGIVR